jgi:hypothetical protein
MRVWFCRNMPGQDDRQVACPTQGSNANAFSLVLYCCLIGGFTLLAVIVRRVDRQRCRRRYLAWKEPKYPIVIADRRVRLPTRHKSSRKRRP